MKSSWMAIHPLAAIAGSLVLLASLAHSVNAAACYYKIELDWDAPRQASSVIGEVNIAVVNDRSWEDGGETITKIGRIRGGYGNPFPVCSSGPDMDQAMLGFLADALLGAGFGPLADPDASRPTVVLRVTKLWSDGYTSYDFWFEATVQIIPAGSSQPAWGADIAVSYTLGSWPNKKNEARAYKELLNDGLGELVSVLMSPDFQAALSGHAPTATVTTATTPVSATSAPATSAPASGGCGKDTDCKGDRICDDGRCVSP
jgi:hypothetical protein